MLSREERIKNTLLLMLTYIGIGIAYVFVISKEFDYYGYTCVFSLSKFFLCTLSTLFLLILHFNIKKIFFSTVWIVSFVIFYLGSITYYQFNNDVSFVPSFTIIFTLFVLFCFSKLKYIKIKHNKTLNKKENISRLHNYLFIIIVILFVPFLRYLPYINLKNLLFIDVYETRELFKIINTSYTAYLMAPLSRVLLPVAIVWSFEAKSKRIYVYILMLLYIYLCGAIKSMFLGLVVLLIFYKFNYKKSAKLLIYGILCCAFGGVIMYIMFNNNILINLPIRRFLLVPAKLTNEFWLFFKDNLTYLSHSPFSLGLIEYKYPLPIISYMGKYYYGLNNYNPNVGIITEGLFSFGLIGGLLFGVLFCLILIYFYMFDLDDKYFGILFVYIYYLNTSIISTLLLTHGLFIFLIMTFFFLRKDSSSCKNYELLNF